MQPQQIIAQDAGTVYCSRGITTLNRAHKGACGECGMRYPGSLLPCLARRGGWYHNSPCFAAPNCAAVQLGLHVSPGSAKWRGARCGRLLADLRGYSGLCSACEGCYY